jgi:ADP-ribose pyrophosphatase YjhB (NUDIX family)
MTEPQWLTLGRELQALAQTGLTFTRDPFDRQRYERITEIAALVMENGFNTEPKALLDTMLEQRGYAAPKVDVRGAALRDGKVLMVREVADGLWTLPGGWADVNQSASECVVREIREESGFETRALKLAAVYDHRKSGHPPRFHHYVYKMFFVCEITGGSALTSVETSEVGFFARDALPPLSLGRVTAAQIERMFDHAADTSLPTDFD